MKQGRLGIVYLVVETSLPANKKSPHTPTTPTPTPTTATPTTPTRTPTTPTPTSTSTSRRVLSRAQAEGWAGVFGTEYRE